MVCESFVEHLLLNILPKIFPNLNVVGHLAVPAGWGSCLPRLAIFKNFFYINIIYNCDVIYGGLCAYLKCAMLYLC